MLGAVQVNLTTDNIAAFAAVWLIVGPWFYFVTMASIRYNEERKARERVAKPVTEIKRRRA